MAKPADVIGSQLAAALAARRWEGRTAEERAEHGRLMAAKRWKGHKAKRPASSRRKSVSRATKDTTED